MSALPSMSGLVPVMITPFLTTGEIDIRGLEALIEWYLAHGATALFACCQSSEIDYMDWEERCRLARHVVERVHGRVPVVASGTLGCGDLEKEAACIRSIAGTGVSAVVAITGHLVPSSATDAETESAYNQIAELTPGVSLGLYECPKPYKRLVPPNILRRLSATGRWIYLKETSCDATLSSAKIAACAGSRLRVFEACAANIVSSLDAGAAGCSPIIANLLPDLVAKLCSDRDPELQRDLADLAAIAETGYPFALKQALALSGMAITATCRRPCEPVSPELPAILAKRTIELRAQFRQN